jgi:hypothetical protein
MSVCHYLVIQNEAVTFTNNVVPLLRLLNLLLRDSSKIYIENSQQIERKIILQDQEITPLFDTPYLIKGIRNYRITKDLVWEVNEEILSVKLDHIVKVYLYDSAWGELRALHKITDMQIRSKRCPMQLKF